MEDKSLNQIMEERCKQWEEKNKDKSMEQIMNENSIISEENRWDDIIDEPNAHQCPKCKMWLPKSEFYDRRKTRVFSCKKCHKKHVQKHYQKNKKNISNWRKTNRNKRQDYREAVKKSQQKLRLEILTHYGGNPPKCACCGETELNFLSIDHIHGGGNQHRKITGSGARFYQWLKRNGFPDGFRVFCMNCNWGSRRNNGICPHQCSNHNV